MEITCSYCNADFTLPDDRLPDVKKFKLSCPKCKETLIIDREIGSEATSIPESFPHDATVAFLYVPDGQLAKRIEVFLKGRGIYVSEATTPAMALEKIKINYYQMIILEEDDVSQEILQVVRKWNGLRRRDTNVIQVKTETKSMQQSDAFFRSVNFVIGKADVERIEYFLEIILKEYESYRDPWVVAEKKIRMDS